MSGGRLRYPETDPIAFRVLNEIGIIAQLSSAAAERALPEGLSLAGFGVLNHLTRLGGEPGPARLANAFQVTKGAMTNTLQRLESKGWIALRPDPEDGRAKRVAITEQGRAMRFAAVTALRPLMAQVEQALPGEDFAALLEPLARLRAFLDAARD
jgi:DNA-binding MarR family transcriptional regulator